MRDQKQKGFTVLGLVVTVILLVLAILLMMKIVPVFAEYRTIHRVISYAAQGTSEAEVRRRYSDQIRIEGLPNNTTLSPNDLKVQVAGNSTTVSFEYNKEVALIGDSVFLLFKFKNEIRSATAY